MLVIASSLLTFSTTNAADYTVQVGAYQTLTNEAIRQAESHGEVFQSTGSGNLTRLHIGRFATHAEASDKRDQLRNSGFNDAFVTQISIAGSPTNPSNTNTAHYQQPSDTIANAPQNIDSSDSSSSNNLNPHLSSLTEEEKAKAAYLDGKLRIYSDGQFYTLEQYRRLNQF